MAESREISKENISRFSCTSCGADMFFNPAVQKLQCTYCSNTQDVISEGSIDEIPYEYYLEKGAETLQPMALNTMQVGCDSCGAVIIFTPPQTTKECDFCGAKIVAQPQSTDPLIAPKGILPLLVTPKEARAEFQNWVGSLWFAPSKLKSLARAENKRSIYIPYWTFDAYTVSDYTGQRGEYYYETQSYTENGKRKTRRVRKTRWYPASGTVSRQFDDELIPATRLLPHKYLNELKPWGLEEAKPYNPAYLSGHKAQTYQIPLDEGYELFDEIMVRVIRSDVREDIGGDKQRIHDVSTQVSDVTFKHLLLPVYAAAYRYNDKVYQVFVNGRTGEVQGERPYSWIKIGALVLFIILVIIALLIFFEVI